MTRKSLKDLQCSWAQAAEVIGDKWCILILRDALFGVTTFSAFEKSFGVSKSVLTDRLERLVENGVMTKKVTGIGSSRHEYELTDKGRGLFTVMAAIGQWGDEWIMGKGNEPWIVLEKETRKPIKKVRVEGPSNKALKLEDITYKAGPGANERVKEIAKQIRDVAAG